MKTGTHNLNVTPGLDWKCDKTTSILYVTFTLYSDGVAIHSLLSHHHLRYLLRFNVTHHTSAESVLVSISLSPVLSTPEWLVLCLQSPLTTDGCSHFVQVIKKSHIRGDIHHISSRFLQLERS